MEKHNYPGKFIVLEGLDGSGRTTQANLLKDFITSRRKWAVIEKEPTNFSESGRKIIKIIKKNIKAGAEELQKLFAQDRKEHLEKRIIPALKKGVFVICDRYFFSTFAFGGSEGLDLNWLIKINEDFLMPDLTLIFKVKPAICIERIEKRGEPKELFEEKEKLARVWEYYKKFPDMFENIKIIDGEKSIKEVFEQIKEIVISEFLENK